jgi:hypothetical protein
MQRFHDLPPSGLIVVVVVVIGGGVGGVGGGVGCSIPHHVGAHQ